MKKLFTAILMALVLISVPVFAQKKASETGYGTQNLLKNSRFDFWQRNQCTSGCTVGSGGTFANNSYVPDRFYVYHSVVDAGVTVTRVTSDLDSGMAAAISLKATNTTSRVIQLAQPIETLDVISFAGKPVTLSIRYKNVVNASNAWNFLISTDTGTDLKVPATTLSSVPINNSASWATATISVVVPANVRSFVASIFTSSNTVNNAEIITGKWMLNTGDRAAPFALAGGTIGGELALAQRYYEKSYNVDVAPGTVTNFGFFNPFYISGFASGSAAQESYIPFKVLKRTQGTLYMWNPFTTNDGGAGGAAKCFGSAAIAAGINAVGQSGAYIRCDWTTGTTRTMYAHWAVDAEL